MARLTRHNKTESSKNNTKQTAKETKNPESKQNNTPVIVDNKHLSQATSSENPPKEVCVCNQPYNKTHFYIGCDKCDGWYHGKCVKINEEFAQFIDKYFCFRCLNNKTPAQGKFVLKNHFVNNNEVYINSLDTEDPNMYYGYNPNKDAATSRQKKVQLAKLESKKKKLVALTTELDENKQKQAEIQNQLEIQKEPAENRVESTPKTKEEKPVKKKAAKSSKPTKKRRITRHSKADNTDEADKTQSRKLSLKALLEKRKNAKEKLEKEADRTKTTQNEAKSPKKGQNHSKNEMESVLSKLKRREAQLNILLCDQRNVLLTESSIRSLNKDVDTSISRFIEPPKENQPAPTKKQPKKSPKKLIKAQKIAKTANSKKPTKMAKLTKLAKTTNIPESRQKGAAVNSALAASGDPVPPPPKQRMPPPLKAVFPVAAQTKSNVANFDIFHMPSENKGVVKNVADRNKGDADEMKRREDNARKVALSRLKAIPGVESDLAIRLEHSIYNATFKECLFWYEKTDIPAVNAALKEKEFEKNGENSVGKVSLKSNAYTRATNRLLLRLNSFAHLKESLVTGDISTDRLVSLSAKKLNEIEKSHSYRMKTKGHFRSILGEEKGALLEQILFEKTGKKDMKRYSAKSRELIFNLRKNKALLDKVTAGDIEVPVLAEMSQDQLASQELSEWRKEVEQEMMREIIRDKPLEETYRENLKLRNKIPLEAESAPDSQIQKVAEDFEEDLKIDAKELNGNNTELKNSPKHQKMQKTPETAAKAKTATEPPKNGKKEEKVGKDRLIQMIRERAKSRGKGEFDNDNYFKSEIYHSKENFLYSEKPVWKSVMAPYEKPNVISLKKFEAEFFQIGGPKIARNPFSKREKLRMVGRTDIPKAMEYLKHLAANPTLKKIPLAFEVRPSDEEMPKNYIELCSYIMYIKRCPVYETRDKDFVLYFVPPDTKGIPGDLLKRLFRCKQPNGCLWAFGVFRDRKAYLKRREKDKNDYDDSEPLTSSSPEREVPPKRREHPERHAPTRTRPEFNYQKAPRRADFAPKPFNRAHSNQRSPRQKFDSRQPFEDRPSERRNPPFKRDRNPHFENRQRNDFVHGERRNSQRHQEGGDDYMGENHSQGKEQRMDGYGGRNARKPPFERDTASRRGSFRGNRRGSRRGGRDFGGARGRGNSRGSFQQKREYGRSNSDYDYKENTSHSKDNFGGFGAQRDNRQTDDYGNSSQNLSPKHQQTSQKFSDSGAENDQFEFDDLIDCGDFND